MTKKLTEIHNGDVFLYNGHTYVLVDLVIRETHFSMCYDRDYRVVPLSTIVKYENVELDPTELEKLMHVITIKGNDVPVIEIGHEAPFKFESINLIKVCRKKKMDSIYWV